MRFFRIVRFLSGIPCHLGVSKDNSKLCRSCFKWYNTSEMEINKKDESLAEILNMKIYQCSKCESAFARKDNLVSHISSVHEKKKPYECHSCDSAYAKKDNLKVHISAIHEGKKPNNCPICGQSFAQKTQMTTHISSVHEGIKPFQCSECNMKFTRKDHLIRHKISIHPDFAVKLKSDSLNLSDHDYYIYPKQNMSENLFKPKSKPLNNEKSPKKSRGRPPKPKEPQIELGMHSVCNFTFNSCPRTKMPIFAWI